MRPNVTSAMLQQRLKAFIVLAAACAGGAGAQPAPASPPMPAAAGPAAAPKSVPAVVAAKGHPTVNPGFESTSSPEGRAPEGWFTIQHAGNPSYRYILDTENPHGGKRSLRIDYIGPEPFGAIAQVIDAATHVGKVAKLSGWLRTKDASDEGGGLTLLVLQSGNTLAHNFMFDAPVKGTTEWKRYTITLPIPKGAERLEIGAMMRGRGSLWFDDAELEFVAP